MDEPKINWVLLRQMRNFIANDVSPAQFDMSQFWAGIIENWEEQTSMPCGSAGCVIGHCLLNRELNPERNSVSAFCEGDLGIDSETPVWGYLFSEQWANGFDVNDDEYTLDEYTQLKQAIHRMDQVLELDGVSLEALNDLCEDAVFNHRQTLKETVSSAPAHTGEQS